MQDQIKVQLLLIQLNTFIELLSKKLNVDPTGFSIMGGFARRMYMLKNNIPMTDVDRQAIHSSDIDIFCDIHGVISSELIQQIDDHNNGKYETLDDLLDIADYVNDAEERSINAISNKFNNVVSNVINSIDNIYHDTNDQGFYIHTEREYIDSLCYTEKTNQLDIQLVKSKIDESLQRHNVKSPTSFMGISFESDNTLSFQQENKHKSFNISAKNLSFTVPVCETIQLVFGSNTNDETLNSFDFDNSKFKMDYPFTIDFIVSPDVDDIYHIKSMTVKDITPFRIVDRLRKYERYGFSFDNRVMKELNEHIDTFIDKHDIEDLPTYKSTLY